MPLASIWDRTVKFKMLLTLSSVLLIFVVGYIVLLKIFHEKEILNKKIQKQELDESVNAVMLTRSEAYNRVVADYSVFSWMRRFIENPKGVDGHTVISSPEQNGVSFIQIYNLKKQLVYSDVSAPVSDTISIPDEVFVSLLNKKQISTCLLTKYGIVEIVGSTVHESSDRKKLSRPRGMVFFGKLLDDDYLHTLADITNSNVILELPAKTVPAKETLQTIVPLIDFKKNTVGQILLTKSNLILDDIEHLNSFLNAFFILFCLSILILGYLTYLNLVFKPLDKIDKALDEGGLESLTPLLGKKNEFGRIADLIKRHSEQRSLLEENIEELNAVQQSAMELNVELVNQKLEIEEQNTKLQEYNQEMMDQNQEILAIAESFSKLNNEITESMKYASFIQKAVLSPAYELLRFFPEHFIFYLPKNIVSGDFYWFKPLKDGRSVLAVADCTGHGLSGALLSMLGISYLNEIVSQYDGDVFKASDILNSLRSFLISSLHQHESDTLQDGMDIILCVFDKDMRTVNYSSAMHNLFIVRTEKGGEPELFEYKGDRLPIGAFNSHEKYTDHMIEIKNDDLLCLYTDGIVDQFGGPLQKKYMTSRLKKLLLSIAQMPLDEQKQELITTYRGWRGQNEQTDDMLIVGVKIKQPSDLLFK
jgi:serine phosphatase RsbU (regulator of sigma subunit)